MKFWLKILLAIILMNLLGGLGAFFTMEAIPSWYADLKKPPGVPPNWVFGPVWTALYTLMGIAVALVWDRGEPQEAWRKAIGWFVIQMVLNVIWTPVFFGLNWLLVALAVIVLLLFAIAFTIKAFARAYRPASWLLIPYILWVSYATYLNAGYWWLNR